MKVGDLVKADNWVQDGKTGIIISIQDVVYCIGAWVIMDDGIHLIRIENLAVINESR